MTRPFVVKSLKQLLAVASPVREDITDALAVLGPSSVPELAKFIGRSRNALYYHVRALRDCGLLIETKHSGEGTRTTARYDLPGRPFSVRYDLSTARSRRAVIALARIRLRSAMRGFVRAARPEIAVTEGPQRNLWVTRWKGWLSEKELEAVNEHLWELIHLLQPERGERRDKRKPYELTFAFAPVIMKTPD